MTETKYQEAWRSLRRHLYEMSLSDHTVWFRSGELVTLMDEELLAASNEGITSVEERLTTWAP